MQTALILCRFAHFWVLLTLFGIYLSHDLLLRSRLARGKNLLPNRVMRWLAGSALISAIAWLMLTAASMAGSWAQSVDPQTLLLVLSHTSFGKFWAWHMGLNLLLLALLLKPGSPPPTLRLLLATLLLATLAPVGHVAMFDGVYGGMLILNQFVHLLSVGAWLGGLCLLLMLLLVQGRHAEIDMRAVLLRFGGFGYFMVALIIVTGLINVRVMSGAPWPAPAFSGFGLVLAVKVSMVLCMLALALFNRLMLSHHELRLDIVRVSIMVECLFGMAALAAVSLLGTLPPMLAE
ncbi:copper homeostasis membrane protein CopD [Pseudomonas quasicaspiana]|uniref:copper homeostasis membrane protein CopD n=1 Tax=Pseudomonas quasicaspiana TaxID=2829821 RepID=UPI001E2A1679|nr:copper homeostasis membrane protein CopD [Pseudomonas quasicaspiana]MCD5973624.1 copper homeostasis membrane protein CopD [Pseudomonas quasicaspiana]